MAAIPVNIAEHVGRTPMIELTRMAPEGVRIFGKLESFNPGGSVKDRIGVAMIEAAEADGRIEPGRTTIVEATSGNTGIALAFVCAAKGYDLVLTLPQGMSREREALLRLYGARVEVIESLGGMNEAVEAARAMAERDDVFLPDQFSNPANPEAHRAHDRPGAAGRRWTARSTCSSAASGRAARSPARARSSRSATRSCSVVAVEPASSAGAVRPRARPAQDPGHRRGLRPAGAQPRDHRRGDRGRRRGRDRDRARAAARREGALVGISCGAALWARSRSARRPESRGKRIAVVLPDSGERYVSTPFFAP